MVRKLMLIISKKILLNFFFLFKLLFIIGFFNLYAHSLLGAEVNITSKTEFNNISITTLKYIVISEII